MKPVKCEDCHFFSPTYEIGKGEYGVCNRNAPIPIQREIITEEDELEKEYSVQWPFVWVWSWCGEYKKRK